MPAQWVFLFVSLLSLSLACTSRFYPLTNPTNSTDFNVAPGFFANPTNETLTLIDPSSGACRATNPNQRAINVEPAFGQIPTLVNWAIRWQTVVNYNETVDCISNTFNVGDGYTIALLNSAPLTPNDANAHRAGFGSQLLTSGGLSNTGFGLVFDWSEACRTGGDKTQWGALRRNDLTVTQLAPSIPFITGTELARTGTFNHLWKYNHAAQTVEFYMAQEGSATPLQSPTNLKWSKTFTSPTFYETVFWAQTVTPPDFMKLIITTAGCDYLGLQIKNMEVNYGCEDECALNGCEEWPNGINAYGSVCSKDAGTTAGTRNCTCLPGLGVQALLTQETLSDSSTISKCVDIDECAEWGCGPNAFCSTSPDKLNERTCTCKATYAISINLGTTPWTIVGEEVVVGRGAWDKCTQRINLCTSPGCNPLSTCTQTTYDTRECTCQAGFSTVNPVAGTNLVNGAVPGSVVALTSNNTAPTCDFDINECNIVQFNCSGVSLSKTASGTCVSSATPGTRQCDCAGGLIPFSETFSGSDYLTPYQGCFNTNPCALYGCNGDGNATCTNTGANTRNCTCPLGFSPDFDDLTGSAKFPGCVDINECAVYPCGTYTVSCRENALNQRTCYCGPGTTPNVTGVTNQTLIGSAPATIKCNDIDECAVYGCPDKIGAIPACTTLQTPAGLNWRSCQCDISLTGSADLQGNTVFGGCQVPITVSKSITLGFTLADGFWNDWYQVLIVDVDNSGTKDFFAVTKQNHLVGWMESTNVAPGKTIDWVSHFNLTKTGLVCNSPVDYLYNLNDFGRLSFFCVNENGDLVLHALGASSKTLNDPIVIWPANPLIRTVTTYIAKVNTSGSDFILFDQGSLLIELYQKKDDFGLPVTGTNPVGIYYTGVPGGLDTTTGIEYPLWVDFNKDGKQDLVFVHTTSGKFFWFKQNSRNASGLVMDYVGSFQPTGRKPAQFAVFDYNNDTILDFVALTSDCYAMYQVPSLQSQTGAINPTPVADGACPTCGCGFASGIIATDMNKDGQTDLIISISGGALVAINEKGVFKTQKILGGAAVSEVFDMDQDGNLDIVAITSGITVWYKVSAPASCAVNAHACTYNETCTTPDPWKDPKCICADGYDKNFSSFCVDTDECLTNNGNCDQICINTVGSYFCNCTAGYSLLSDGRTCADILECAVNNGGCARKCIELPGSYNCSCDAGYDLAPDGKGCDDRNECDIVPSPCNPVGGACTNLPGTFSCACFDGYWQEPPEEFKCTEKACTWLPWEDWRNGACWVRETRDRSINFALSGLGNLVCPREVSQEWRFNFTAACVPPRTKPGTLFAATEFLNKAFTPFYLSTIYPDPTPYGLFPVRYSLTNFSGPSSDYYVPYPLVRLGYANSNTSYSKRAISPSDPSADTLGIFQFEAPICNPAAIRVAAEDMKQFVSFWLLLNFNSLAYKIDSIPLEGNVTAYLESIGGGIDFNYTDRNCSIILDVSGAYAFDWVPIAIGVPLGIFGLLLLLLLLLYWWRWREMKKALAILSTLPKIITVHYRNCIRHPDQWEILEHDPPLYRKLLTDMEDVNHVMGIFRKLDGNKIRVEHIYAVYNPSLVQAMALTREKFENRVVNDAALFYAEKWKEMNCTRADMKRRQWVKDTFIRRVAEFEWNHELAVPIIPTIHGTAATVAWKICHGGFATLSSLDVGFFGAGIYFTTSAKYAIPYFATKAQPAIIISYLVPGNPYPVIEDPNKPGKLAGEVIKVGYQSHYVLTTNRGMPFEKIEYKNIFDEIVVDQESQVAPAYVLLLDNKGFPALIRDFERRTCEDDPANEEFERL